MKCVGNGICTWREEYPIELRVDKEFALKAIEIIEEKIREESAFCNFDSVFELSAARRELANAVQCYDDWLQEQAEKVPDGEDETD